MGEIVLPEQYMQRVRRVYQLIKQYIPEGELYLFGSYAKRKIKQSSDIDMLVLIDEELDKMVLRKLKWQVEEVIEETLGFEYEVDLKLYTKSHFNKSKETLGFESMIATYMIRLEDSTWK